MASVNELMREIHRLLKHRRDLREQIDRFPKQRKVFQGRITLREQEQQQAQDALKKLKMSVHEKEVTLKTHHQLVKKYEGQLREITSKKEFDALQHEIETTKKAIAEVEDQILTGMMEIDEQTAALPKFAGGLATARKELTDFEATAQERETNLRTMLQDTEAKHREAEAQVPAEILPAYQRIIKAKEHDALAPVRDRACSSCSTSLTVQNYHDLQLGQSHNCTACGRILFLPE